MDTENLDYHFLSDPAHVLRCVICLEVARDPMQHDNCGTLYCSECIEKYGRKPCPNCRENSPTYFKDRKSYHEIQALVVRCRHADRGCSWEGTVANLQSHATKCEFTMATPCQDHNVGMNSETQSFETTNGKSTTTRHDYIPKEDAHSHSISGCHDNVSIPLNDTRFNNKCDGVHELRCTGEHNHTCRCRIPRLVCQNTEKEKHCKTSQQEGSLHLQDCDDCTECCQCWHQLGMCKRALAASHTEILSLKECISILKQGLSTLTKTVDGNKPLAITVKNYTKLKANEEMFYSRPFYSHPGGYKMCLKVNPNAQGTSPSSYISVFIKLLHGPYDDLLFWPFVGSVRIELLDQSTGRDHHCFQLLFHKKDKKFPGNHLGKSKFISHNSLLKESTGHMQYLIDDDLHFRITIF